MIQRIQSVFLLIAAGFFGGEFFTSFASVTQSITGIFSDGLYNVYDNPFLLALAGLGLVLSLITIFLFKNRALQTKLCYFIGTLSILLPLVGVLIYSNQMEALGDIDPDDQLGLYLPIGSLIFSIMAASYIKKDQKLVKSMDRLR